MSPDAKDIKLFDQWRADYPGMSDEEHFAFCESAALKWPEQKHYNQEHLFKFLAETSEKSMVLEMGGWKGEAAKECLSAFEINAWINIELSQTAIDLTPDIIRYIAIRPKTFRWWRNEIFPSTCNVFLATHVIEHLADPDLYELLESIKSIPNVYFEAPIAPGENGWEGYYGTHILKMGWNSINTFMEKSGYAVTRYSEHCWGYRK